MGVFRYLMNFDADTALKAANSILNSIDRLEDFPDSGSVMPGPWLNKRGYRMIICVRHVSIYRQIEEIIYIYNIADIRTEYYEAIPYVMKMRCVKVIQHFEARYLCDRVMQYRI